MSKSNVNPNHYNVGGRERQGEDILQGRHKRQYPQNLGTGPAASHAAHERPALVPGPPPQGAVPSRTARKVAAAPSTRTANPKQVSGQRRKPSTTRKGAASRRGVASTPRDARGKR
jgi:hypothetical protein